MELTDVMPLQEWIEFTAELFERLHLNCAVFSAVGVAVTGKPRWCNALCPEIKSRKESLATICAAGNQYFMAQARKTGEPVVGECDAGLLKIAVPIIIDGQFLGTAGGCGRLPEGGEIDTFIIEKSAGLDREAIARLSRDLVPMSDTQARRAADFIHRRLAEKRQH